MVPFSPIDSTIFTVKSWYVIGREAFTIRNKAATMNDVPNDKSCAAMVMMHSKLFFYIFRSDME